MIQPQIHLASSSPRRRELLAGLGISFSHAGVDLDESRNAGEPVDDMVMRLAREKAFAVDRTQYGGIPVLAADTVVVLADQVFGKPRSKEEALAMLAALSGQSHRVLTAVALIYDDELGTAMSTTEVQFRDINPDEALAYWQSGEPAGKAGAYAIQGLGGIFVGSIKGSYTGVVGLPVFETADLLAQAGIGVLGTTD
jgi:septum formation protein